MTMPMKRVFFITISALALPIAALAVDPPPVPPRTDEVFELLNRVTSTLNIIVAILVIIATLVFIWGVILFLTSSGDPTKRGEGRQYMIWGIVALAVIAAAWAVANVIIAYFFGVDTSATKGIGRIDKVITPGLELIK